MACCLVLIGITSGSPEARYSWRDFLAFGPHQTTWFSACVQQVKHMPWGKCWHVYHLSSNATKLLFLLLLKLFHWGKVLCPVKKKICPATLAVLLLVGIGTFVQHAMCKNSWMLTVVPSLGLSLGMAQEAQLCFVPCGWLNLSSSAQPMCINGISVFQQQETWLPKDWESGRLPVESRTKSNKICKSKPSGIVNGFEWSWALAKVKVLWFCVFFFFLQNFIFYFFPPWLLLWHLQIILFCRCYAETLSDLPKDTL